MISGLFIYDAKGDVLMSKLYRAGIKRNIADVLRIQVISAPRVQEVRSPILTLGSTTFVYIKSGNLWICAVCRSNQDCAVILEFLFKLESVIGNMVGAQYIASDKKGKWNLTDNLITDNFTTIYDYLDEVVEFGFPTTLDTVDVSKSNGKILKNEKKKQPSSPKNGASNSTPWRVAGIKYRKNEVFVDVEEKLNVILEEGDAIRTYVDGKINMKSHLSGMPECQFGFSENVIVDGGNEWGLNGSNGEVGYRFHPCVSLKNFDFNREISFVPPDGEFTLMSYQCIDGITLPFKVYSCNSVFNKTLKIKVQLISEFPSKITATNLMLKIVAPNRFDQKLSQASSGKIKWHPEENAYIWKFSKFAGQSKQDLTVDFDGIPNVQNVLVGLPPMTLNFTTEMFSPSGLTVNNLSVNDKMNYKTVKWVKYITYGSYEIRH